jgi:SAM-dependent methyltransferase
MSKFNSKMLFEKYALGCFGPDKSVLEVGAGAEPSDLQELMGSKSRLWHTLDVFESKHLTYSNVDPYHYPIEDGKYDVVLSNQVLEHVEKIWVWIKELARICAPGGRIITINPVAYPYHGSPTDCWRVYPEGMRALYAEADLRVELSVCESLEIPGYRRYWPRYSFFQLPWYAQWSMRVLGHIGFPVMCALDTITIGEKPRTAAEKR